MNQKVLAYITRERHGRLELLVFRHREEPDAGIQIPAGTPEAGEPLEQALVREIEEESGLTGLTFVRKVAAAEEPDRFQVRHVYHLHASADLPDAWTHRVGRQGCPGSCKTRSSRSSRERRSYLCRDESLPPTG